MHWFFSTNCFLKLLWMQRGKHIFDSSKNSKACVTRLQQNGSSNSIFNRTGVFKVQLQMLRLNLWNLIAMPVQRNTNHCGNRGSWAKFTSGNLQQFNKCGSLDPSDFWSFNHLSLFLKTKTSLGGNGNGNGIGSDLPDSVLCVRLQSLMW